MTKLNLTKLFVFWTMSHINHPAKHWWFGKKLNFYFCFNGDAIWYINRSPHWSAPVVPTIYISYYFFSKVHMKRFVLFSMNFFAFWKTFVQISLITFCLFHQQNTKKNKVKSVKVRWWTLVCLFYNQFILMRLFHFLSLQKTKEKVRICFLWI